jgi:hypothetical protein
LLVIPSLRLPNVRVVWETTAIGIPPEPVRLTVCELGVALSAKLSEALKLPLAGGVNVTLTVQVLPELGVGASVAPEQVSALLAKLLAFVPTSVTVEMVRGAVPVLVTVSVWAALVVFTS